MASASTAASSSAFFKWRMFNFFNVAKDVDEGAVKDAIDPHLAACATSGRGHLLFGDSSGRVHLFSRHHLDPSASGPSATGPPPRSFQAFHRGVRLLHQLRQSCGLLLAVGEDDPGVNPYLKVFDLDQPDRNGDPALVRVSRVALGGKVSAPTMMAAHEGQNLLAIAYEDGSVVLHRGDVRYERGSKQKKILEGPDKISGLAFKTTNKATLLYVVTDASVRCFCLSQDNRETSVALDNVGCAPGLAVPVENLQDAHIVTGRPDAVYCYTPEGRGQCYAFEGDKVALHWFRNYLVVVTRDASKSKGSTPAEASADEKHTLTVFDVQNKFVAFTAPLRPVRWVLSEWGMLFAVSADGDCRLYQLTEKDIQTKLELLFKKNCYDVAVRVAEMQQYDEDGLVDIFRQYGDHLYTKGDFSGAIDNYVKTIGHLEPSYVIRNFMDAHKIHHLTEYLQALHVQGLANEDHTTLLLNCYTKLKDKNKLDEFIFKEGGAVDFDVDIAIKVCRQSGYNKHALALAEKHGRHEWYLKLQLEDNPSVGGAHYKEALAYISKLDFPSAEHNLRKYGASLMHHLPNETTSLLKRLCTDYKPDGAPLVTSEDMLQGQEEDVRLAARPEHFLHLFVRNSAQMVDFLEFMIGTRPEDMGGGVYNTLLEHYLHQYSDAESTANYRKKMEEKSMEVLRKNVQNCDEDQALILCQRHSFHQGALYLYERRGLFAQVLNHHVTRGDVGAAVQVCRKFGSRQPDLWVRALQFIAREGEAEPVQMAEVLENVERNRLLSPLLIVSTLSNSSNATLKLVRGYLKRLLETEDRRSAEDGRVIDKYSADTAAIREGNDRLRNEAAVIQNSKCSACDLDLELPAVHFLCQHSYHEHCFQSYSPSDSECPKCHPENRKIMDIVRSQEKSRDRHDDFQYHLEKAENSFEVVAEYFGRGMFRR